MDGGSTPFVRLALLSLALSVAAGMASAQEVRLTTIVDTALTQKVRSALNKTVNLDFDDVPLREVLNVISREHDIPVVVNRRALEDLELNDEVRITALLRGLKLSSSLRHILRDFGCACCIRDEALIITSVEDAESQLSVRVYPVSDLVGADKLDQQIGPREIDFQPLIDLVQKTIHPTTWDTNGGQGAMDGTQIPVALVVSQTEEVHDGIEDLFARLRAGMAQEAKQKGESSRAAEKKDARRDQTLHLCVFRVKRFHQPAGNETNQSEQGTAIYEAEKAAVGDLAELVQQMIEPGDWNEADGKSVRAIPGALVVRHRREVLQRVYDLLNETGALEYSVPYFGDMGFTQF